MAICEVCGQLATIIGTERIDDRSDCDDARYEFHSFCQEHYQNWCNNEIEIPAERLEVLNDHPRR